MCKNFCLQMAALVGSSNMADSNFHRKIGHVTENRLLTVFFFNLEDIRPRFIFLFIRLAT